MRHIPLLAAVALCLGAKACAIGVSNGPWYGTWSLPAQFDLRNAAQDQFCPSDVFAGFQHGGPLVQFSGVPKYLDGDETTATAPVENFSMTDQTGAYVHVPTYFRAWRGNGFYTYHFEGVYLAPNCHVAGSRCDYFYFNQLPGSPDRSYEFASGWSQGGTSCMNHYTGVTLDSTNPCYFGTCTDHQTVAWVPHGSTEKLNACDWRPDVCVVGHFGDTGCPAATPYAEDNGTCCSCNTLPPGSSPP